MSNSKRRRLCKELCKSTIQKVQYYFGIPLTLIVRTNYDCVKAKRYYDPSKKTTDALTSW